MMSGRSEPRSACLMRVRRAPLPSSCHELGCNTITAALHISERDWRITNAKMDLYVGAMKG